MLLFLIKNSIFLHKFLWRVKKTADVLVRRFFSFICLKQKIALYVLVIYLINQVLI